MKRAYLPLLVLVAAFALVASPAVAQSLTLNVGSDGWTTPPGGQSQVDLSQYPIAAAFGAGATVSPSLVPLKGQALNTSKFGDIDTIVVRDHAVTLGPAPSTATVSLTFGALRMVSETPVTVTVGGTSTTYDLTVALSTLASSNGTMTITRTRSDGGTFSSTLNVFPKLIFDDGTSQVIIDCGAGGCSPLSVNATSAAWTTSSGPFNPGSLGIPVYGSGAVDADADGTNDTTVPGVSNYFPGVAPNRTGGHQLVPVAHDHPPVADHQLEPSDFCDNSTPVADEEIANEVDTTNKTANKTAQEVDSNVSIDDVDVQPVLCPQVATPVDRTGVQ